MMQSAYLTAVRRLLDHLAQTQGDAVSSAADLVITALRSRGAVFCSEIGHGIQGDFLNRAGGLAALQPLTFNLSIHDPVASCLADRPRPSAVDRDAVIVRAALQTSNVRPGDVVVLGSVSGRNVRPVELALACREMGVRTIGLTSLQYSAEAPSLHSCGKSLCDVVDVAVDIGAPYGDASTTLRGIDVAVLPVSGVGFAVAGWMIWETVMARMAADGDAPTVFMSVNREGGQAYYEEARRRYNERGY